MFGGQLVRYLFAKVAARFALVVAIIVAILTIENLHRLLADVQRMADPMALLGRLSLALLPEHLSAALPVGLMLAVALSVRQMTLRGEWQMLAASHMGRWRTLSGPLAFALLVTGAQLAIRLELRPAGERSLDRIYREVQAGTHGLLLPVGEPLPLDDSTTLFVTRIAPGSQHPLQGVVVHRGNDVFTAPLAELRFAADGRVRLMLRDGVGLIHPKPGEIRRARFGSMQVMGMLPAIRMVGDDPRHRLDRLSSADLVARARSRDRSARDGALAAMVMRVDAGLFCLVIPLLGVILGKPPRRKEGALGIAVALLLVVLQIKASAWIEDRLAADILAAESVHFLLWIAAAGGLFYLEHSRGEGFVDAAASRFLSNFNRFRRNPRRLLRHAGRR